MYLHRLLKHAGYPNCQQVCRHFAVGRRTVLRDIEFMRKNLGLPIAYDKRKQGFYYTSPVQQFPGVSLSESELFALLVAQKSIANYKGTPFHQPLLNAYNRLAGQFGDDVVSRLRNLGEAIDIRLTGHEELDEEHFQIVLRAVQQRRPLEFRYRKQAAKTLEQRTFHPYQLVCANQRWYVVGHDVARGALRNFVLARLVDPEILPGHFDRPADFKIKDYLAGSFGIFKGQADFKVVVDLDNWAADVLRNRRWHASQQVVELPGGAMRVSFHLDNLEEVEQWVLSWGTHATVVRPKALVDRVQATAQGIVQRYAELGKQPDSPGQGELSLKSR